MRSLSSTTRESAILVLGRATSSSSLCGQGDKIRGARAVERPANIILVPAVLYDQGQRGERQIELRRDGDLFLQYFLESLEGL